MEDQRLTNLVSKLSLNSVALESFGAGGQPVLDTMMASASLAMGKRQLSSEAYMLGRAIYTEDPAYGKSIELIGGEHVIKMFQRNHWPDPDNANYIEYLQRTGKFTEAELQNKAVHYFQDFRFMMARLAMAEIARNSICKTCNGTGKTGAPHYRQCEPCGGKGRRPMNESDRANYMKQNYQKWMYTWRTKYPQVLSMFQQWLCEFDEHLLRTCR